MTAGALSFRRLHSATNIGFTTSTYHLGGFMRRIVVGLVLCSALMPLAVLAQDKDNLVYDFDFSDPNAPSECDMVGSNLVGNCGFETGAFPPWTWADPSGFTSVQGDVPHSGNFYVLTGPVAVLGFVQQNVATIAGHTYGLSYWLRNQGTPNQFRVLWNGAVVRDDTNLGDFGYTQFTHHLAAATGTTSTLRFEFRNDPSFMWFDDVVLLDCGIP